MFVEDTGTYIMTYNGFFMVEKNDFINIEMEEN